MSRYIELNAADSESGGYFEEDYDSTHCEHGTFVGYPGGVDYICGYCEGGTSMASLQREYRRQERYNLRQIKRFKKALKTLTPHVWDGSLRKKPFAKYVMDKIVDLVHITDTRTGRTATRMFIDQMNKVDRIVKRSYYKGNEYRQKDTK